jgi:hypothetical protein
MSRTSPFLPSRKTEGEEKGVGERGGAAIAHFFRTKDETRVAATAFKITTLALLTLAMGCSSPKSATPSLKKQEERAQKTPVGAVNLTPGNSTHYGPDPKREPQWYVQWTTGARADLSETIQPGGKKRDQDKEDNGARIQVDYVTMHGVTGHLFTPTGKPGSTFRAQTGVGDGVHQRLELVGDVHIVSPDLASELICDRAVYDAIAKVLRAKGHVRVAGKVGTIGTLEIWATPDLKYVATPSLFSPPSASRPR